MKTLEVCFIGVGSIARRHIRNFTQVCKDKGFEVSVDALRSGSGSPLPEETQALLRNVYTGELSASKHYDVIFITNPTSLHLETLSRYKNAADSFFIEKPFVDRIQLSEANKLLQDFDKLAYVACPLRYNAVIQYVKNNVNLSKVHSVRAISSSYLPDWRLGQDYRKTYSAHKNLGGGVSIDLIHEWDYLQYLFGQPEEVRSFIGKVSNLEIDSDDLAVYVAKYKDKFVELHLDYFGSKTRRELELITDDDTIIADITNCKVTYLKLGKVVVLTETRDAFQKREMEHFLSLLNNKTIECNDIKTAISTLKLTMGEI